MPPRCFRFILALSSVFWCPWFMTVSNLTVYPNIFNIRREWWLPKEMDKLPNGKNLEDPLKKKTKDKQQQRKDYMRCFKAWQDVHHTHNQVRTPRRNSYLVCFTGYNDHTHGRTWAHTNTHTHENGMRIIWCILDISLHFRKGKVVAQPCPQLVDWSSPHRTCPQHVAQSPHRTSPVCLHPLKIQNKHFRTLWGTVPRLAQDIHAKQQAAPCWNHE